MIPPSLDRSPRQKLPVMISLALGKYENALAKAWIADCGNASHKKLSRLWLNARNLNKELIEEILKYLPTEAKQL